MSTAAFDAFGKIPIRIAELEALCLETSNFRNGEGAYNEAAYNAVCRSCCILIASHIEGTIKDICESVRMDLNFYLKEFKELPDALKRSFCNTIAFYDSVPKADIDKRIRHLIAFFERNTVPVEMDAFPYFESQNKNPKPQMIDRAFEKFGVNNLMTALGHASLISAFNHETSVFYLLRRNLIRDKSILFHFPYKAPRSSVFFDPKQLKNRANQDNLWHTFLEEILVRRHKIAHGEMITNPTSVDELKMDIKKTEIFLYSVAIFFCSEICRSLR